MVNSSFRLMPQQIEKLAIEIMEFLLEQGLCWRFGRGEVNVEVATGGS